MWGANMCSREQAVISLDSQAVPAWVTKLIDTIFSKACNKMHNLTLNMLNIFM